MVRAKGLPDMELARDANTEGAGDAIVGLPIAAVGGLILFSFCLLKRNYTLFERDDENRRKMMMRNRQSF